MGILSFSKNKNKVNEISKDSDNLDCRLNYKSGISADISFKDIEQISLDNGNMKMLQAVNVMYNMPDHTFKSKKYYMDPIFNDNGENITKESYLSLIDSNKPLLKGFFEKNQIDNEHTNYIGSIGYNDSGKPFRKKDIIFERAYKIMLDRKKEKNEIFNNELRSNVNKEPYIKTSHAEDLSNKKCPYTYYR